MVDYQEGLPIDNPAYPEQLENSEQGNVYHLLGVDSDGYGHYWLGSHLKHSVVVRVSEEYEVEERTDWLSKDQVAEYVLDNGLRSLSDLAKQHLEHNTE